MLGSVGSGLGSGRAGPVRGLANRVVDGHDVEPGSEPAADHVVGCRLYRLAGQPDERRIH
jgi:hypothetical protein